MGLLFCCANVAFADFTIQLDAGRLRSNATTAMAAGSLLVLVAAGGDNAFSNTLTPGHYVAGNDILLGVASFATPDGSGPFNTSGGPDETLNVFNINTSTFPTLAQGDLLSLRWFPQISFTQFVAGATPSAGQSFGSYNPLADGNGSNNPDGGASWAVPAAGQLINLNFFTSDSGGGGTQNPMEGFASFSVAAVPEPSTCGAAVLMALTLVGASRRKARD